MSRPDLIKNFFMERNVDAQYNRILGRIQEHQQNRIFIYEVIFFIIFGGIFVNILSSALYNMYLNPNEQRMYGIITFSFFSLLLLYFFYSLLSNKFLPKSPIEFKISVSIYDLYNSLGFEKDDIIESIENKGFDGDDFIVLLNAFKKDIVSTNFLYQTYNFKYEREVNFLHGKSLIYKGYSRDVSLQLNIIINPFPDVVNENRYNSMIFMLSYKILNPNNPSVDEFLFDLKEYIIDISFEEFCDLIYGELHHLKE